MQPAQSPSTPTEPLSKREKETPSFSSSSSNGSIPGTSSGTVALRALCDELRAEGIADPAELLRHFAARAGRRVLDAYRADANKGRGWLETVLRDGASRLRDTPHRDVLVLHRPVALEQMDAWAHADEYRRGAA